MRVAQTGRMRRSLTLVLVLAACGTPPAGLPAAPSEPVLTPIPRAEIIESSQGAPQPTRPPHIEAPAVTITGTDFPISPPSASLAVVPPGEFTVANAKLGLNQYLEGLDRYRDTGRVEHVQITGAFRDAVVASLDATKRPGVQRKFALTSYSVERVYAKPWGTQALVDVVATITDTVVSGNAAPEVETGRLRLAGDRGLTVVDGWNGMRWFNGISPVDRGKLVVELQQPFGWYLQVETWVPGSQLQPFYAPGGETPFTKARNALIQKFDRDAIASRTLTDVTATVGRFETLTEIGDGIATITLVGTVVTRSATGVETRTPFAKVVQAFRKAFATGHGHFWVVDERGPDGSWLSGGDIALKDVDRSFG